MTRGIMGWHLASLILLALVLTASPLEQLGTVLVPPPAQVTSGGSTTVRVDFPTAFKDTPLVVATPYFRSFDPSMSDLIFIASTCDVGPSGFNLYVERIDERLPWREAMVLVSWIAWDPKSLGDAGESGEVPVPPEPLEDFAGDVVLEFTKPFREPPVVIATARAPEGVIDSLPFALTLSKVTESYAIINVFNLGEAGAWQDLIHVAWRAWGRSQQATGGAHSYEVQMTELLEPKAVIPLSRFFHMEPVILSTIWNDPGAELSSLSRGGGGDRTRKKSALISGRSPSDRDARAPKAWDTYVGTLFNISDTQFEVNVKHVYQTEIWKDGIRLGWVAQNSSKVCLDDCMGHGACIGGHCRCDPGWTGNDTCDVCQQGFWGPSCHPCTGYNATTGLWCSGHGLCDGGGTIEGTGECNCDIGYTGDDCRFCADGFIPDRINGQCSVCPKADNVTCAGHGTCVDKEDDDPNGPALKRCECDGAWAGDYCDVCQRGYAGEGCEIKCPSLCSGKGDCVIGIDGKAMCACNEGWDSASFCQTCDKEYYGSNCAKKCPDCGVHGLCNNGPQGNGNCSCDAGYTSSTYCRGCSFGYFSNGNDLCSECPGGADNPCSGHSDPPWQCPNGLCVCAQGYHGEDCSSIDEDRGWAIILVIILACAMFVGLVGLAATSFWKTKGGSDKRKRTKSKTELDPELRKRLLEQCPELSGMEDALVAMGSDAADWLIDFKNLEMGNRIGSGTSSLVYRGLYCDELVAIKKLQSGRCDPHLFGLFFRSEAELLSKLHHPHVVRFYGVCYHEGDFYIVTEFCENTLQRILGSHRTTGNKLDLEDLYRIAFQIANGMAYLHSKHVVHRDLKPENVLMDDRGDVKICDFGLSKLIGSDTQMTVQVGTPAFMAPEMAHGTTEMSESVDVYSYGVLLWTLWTCQNPYHYLDVTPVQLLSRVVGGLRPKIDRDVPKELAELMRACWEADPSMRPTFDALVSELRTLLRTHVASNRRSFLNYSPPSAGGTRSGGSSTTTDDAPPGGDVDILSTI